MIRLARALLALVVLAVTAFTLGVLAAGQVLADTADSPGIIGVPDNWLSTDAANVVKLLGLGIPILVTVITKRYASARVKALTALTASALLGSVGYLLSETGGYNVHGFVNGFLAAFVPALLAYLGLWKHVGGPALERATENVGFGSPSLRQASERSLPR